MNTPVAYFCMEFGIDDRLPIYSGGLGILAGDVVKEAADKGLPMVAVGLLYHDGFFRQTFDEKGLQLEQPQAVDVVKAELELVMVDGEPLVVEVPLLARIVKIQVWRRMVGSVPLYLLDTLVEGNTDEERNICRQLYTGDAKHRIEQEMVLGVGGARVLAALGLEPMVYHLNEGHSAFAAYEITHQFMQRFKQSFEEALARTKHAVVYTNHTIVPAGNDVFPMPLVATYLEHYARELGVPVDELLSYGKLPDDESQFGMTILALTMSYRANAVSKLHERMAQKLWPEYQFYAVTNGVHLPTWVSSPIKSLAGEFTEKVASQIDGAQLWQAHVQAKHMMIAEIARRCGVVLDPRVLTLGWARRFVHYKRPEMLFSDMDRLATLLKSSERPVQLVMAGKAHPSDDEGKAMMADIHRLISERNLQDRVVQVPDYSITLAQFLVAGTDVWVNTPIRGQEASGTSGMKAGANGVLQCSTSDGWVDEVDWQGMGWILSAEKTDESLYQTLGTMIVPLYYRQKDGYPAEWTELMKRTMGLVWEDFSATRMLHEYTRWLYLPAGEKVADESTRLTLTRFNEGN